MQKLRVNAPQVSSLCPTRRLTLLRSCFQSNIVYDTVLESDLLASCEDCRLFYGIASTRFTLYLESCTKLSLTVAPIPSSVLAQQSSRNQSLATAPITGGEAPTLVLTFRPTPAWPIPTATGTASTPGESGSGTRLGLSTFHRWLQVQAVTVIGLLIWQW